MWSKFEILSSEDETINNAFCTNGLFKISSKIEITKEPYIQSVLQNKKLLISVDESLALLENENVSECNFLDFSAKIECLDVSQSGDLIICALSDGNVHGIYIKGVPVFNLMIQEEDVGLDKTFVKINRINDVFYILCANGVLYKLSNMDEKVLSESIVFIEENQTYAFNETILNNTILERVSSKKFYETVNTFCMIESLNDEEIFAIAASDKNLLVIDKNFNESVTLDPAFKGLKRIFNLDNFVLALTFSGHLVEICPYTKFIYNHSKYMEHSIFDLTVLESNDEEIELLILTNAESGGCRMMQIIDFPTMKCKYSLNMTDNIWLIQQPKYSLNIFYISGNKNANGFVQDIEMKIISETQPTLRFQKLIQKEHLEEAEEFARQFDLSLQPIHEARVKRMLMGLGPSITSDRDDLNQQFNNLLSEMKLVEDKKFLLGIRFTEIPDRKLMKIFLEFLLENFNQNEYLYEANELNEQLLRLETLNLIDAYECDLEWSKFVHHPNLVKKCIELFKTDIAVACLIWSRHCSSIIPMLDDIIIAKLMNGIPSNITPFQIIQWLNHFVPSVLHNHPHMMGYLTDWSIQKTKNLQYTNLWPDIGLEFVTNIRSIFVDIHFLFVDIRLQYERNIDKIQRLITALEHLVVLKKKFHLSLTLDEYMNESYENIAFRLLRYVQLSNLKVMVNDFLYPIFREKGLSQEPSIIRYIDYLVSNKNMSYWQERSIAAIELIHNEESKLQCVLLVLRSSPVPWSETVNSLVKYGAASHALASEIYIEHKTQIIKIIKVKYGWPADYHCTNSDLMKITLRIMKIQLPEMIQDVTNLLKAAPDISHQANLYLLNHLASRGEIESALQYIDSLNEAQRTECCVKFISIVTRMLNENAIPENKVDDFVELLTLSTTRLGAHCKPDFNLKDIHHMFTLRKNFGLVVDINCLSNSTMKKQYLQRGLDCIINRLKDNRKECVSILWSDVKRLTDALNIDILDGIFEILKMLKNIHLTCISVVMILENIDLNQFINDKLLDIVVLLLVQQMDYCKTKIDQVDSDDPMAYPLAYILLTKCLNHHLTDYMTVVDLLRWVRIVDELYDVNVLEVYKTNKVLPENIFNTIFAPYVDQNGFEKKNKKRDSMSVFEQVNPTIETVVNQEDHEPVIKCVGLALHMLVFDMGLFPKMTEFLEPSESINADFFASLEKLLKMKKHSSVFSIVQYIMKIQRKLDKKMLIPTQFVSILYKKTLKYILSQKEPNYTDAMSVLFADDNPVDCLKYLENALTNGSQKVAYLTLSEIYHSLIGNAERAASDHESRMTYFYHSELCKRDSSLNTKKKIDFLSISHLMKELRNKILDVDLLRRLSDNFNWGYQTVLVSQVITVMSTQELEYEIKTDIYGKDEIVVKTSVDAIKKLCQPYINEITNIELFKTTLIQYMNEINFYFYELYMSVIEILSDLNELPKEMEVWKNMLYFLKHKMSTKRRNRAGQLEIDSWLKKQLDVGVLPKISKYRLPFKTLVEEPLKNTLTDEVCVDNFEKWLPLIQLKALLDEKEAIELQEYFCMLAVKNSISEYKAQTDESEEVWHLKPTNNAFLQSILRILKFIEDRPKILFLLYFVTNHAPDGADQVEAAFECYKFALENEPSLTNNEKAQDVVNKIRRKYPMFRIQHLLHLYGLTDDKLFQLVENPKELINALYTYEVIMKAQKSDINKVAKEIAKLHGIDIYAFQMGLVQKWLSLSTPAAESNLEDTFYEDFIKTANDSDCETSADEFVVRAHYILNSWESENAVQFLVTQMFQTEGTLNTGKQLQIYECFTKLIDDKNLMYGDVFGQNHYIVLKCVHLLNQLGYNFTLDKFHETDKMSFLKKLWQNHATNPKSLIVMSYICLGYDICQPQIWNGVLKQMVQLSMLPQLSSLIFILSSKESLVHLSGLKLAWECVIKAPFKKANRVRSFEQDAVLAKSLLLLQMCPVASHLNLIEIAELCIRVNRPHMAAILTNFATGENKTNIINMMLPVTNDEFRKDILELEEYGIASVITKSVLKELKSKK